MPRPAWAPLVLSAPVCFNGKKIKNTVRVSDSLDLSGQIWARTVCKQKKRQRGCPHPSPDGNPWNSTWTANADPGPLTIAVFLFNDPPPPHQTVKVIWRRSQSFKSHPINWWSKGEFWLFWNYFICVCVGGGGSSDFFHFPKFQGGPTYVIQGEGASNFLPREWSPIAER